MKKEDLRNCKVIESRLPGEKGKEYIGRFHKWFDHQSDGNTEQCVIVELESGEVKTFGLHNSKITFVD